MSANLTEMMSETTTCNDLQVTVLATTQEEPQASEAQLQCVVDTSQCGGQEEESQPLNYFVLADDDVEKVNKSEDVKHNAIMEFTPPLLDHNRKLEKETRDEINKLKVEGKVLKLDSVVPVKSGACSEATQLVIM
ncbi:hypothetical protein HAX54_048929 [Datura stramonium]|uniref:Uncharacterized protein n=1 Tax=Datura stramonium TaxID=4076 RepID=A0ABS8SUF5_DATST|nr:hypothetical protein [Datura stramonium]